MSVEVFPRGLFAPTATLTLMRLQTLRIPTNNSMLWSSNLCSGPVPIPSSQEEHGLKFTLAKVLSTKQLRTSQ